MRLSINEIIKISESIEKINKLNISLPINIGSMLIKNKIICDNVITSFLNECEKKFNNVENFDSTNEEYQNMLKEEVDLELNTINLSNKKYSSIKLPFSIICSLIPLIN